jgi:hypothetical protein
LNWRLAHEKTPEGRLAAIAVALATEFEDRYNRTKTGPAKPDVADFREAMGPYIHRELLRARIDESEKTIGMKNNRRAELIRLLYQIEAKMPPEHRL